MSSSAEATSHAPDAAPSPAPQWTDRSPDHPGLYWCEAPASYEPPVLVRIEADAGGLRAWFPAIPVPVPMRMLAGARWCGPLAERRSLACGARPAG